jgi:ketosteroid isomerase-like protein
MTVAFPGPHSWAGRKARPHRPEEIDMQRVPTLERATRTIFEAMRRGDADAVAELIADEAEVVWIGTDPQEYWHGHDTMVRVFQAQLGATGGFPIDGVDPVAYGTDDVAWVSDQPSMQLPDGSAMPFRITGVARSEPAGWKFVQFHVSIGVANEDALGSELPV